MGRRIYRKLADFSWLESREQRSEPRCVFSIERAVETDGTRSREISYSISSLDASAEQLMEIAREH